MFCGWGGVSGWVGWGDMVLRNTWSIFRRHRNKPGFRHIPPGEPRNTLSSMREKIGDHSVEQRSKECFECRTQKAEEKRNLKTLRNETVAAFPGRILDPSLAGKGWSKISSHGRRRTGKTTGRWSGQTKSNEREPGGPTQRRDPTAQEELVEKFESRAPPYWENDG